MQRGTDTCMKSRSHRLSFSQSIRLLQGALLQVLQDQQEGSSTVRVVRYRGSSSSSCEYVMAARAGEYITPPGSGSGLGLG